MPTNVVDFSAVSEIIRDEPWQLHFWELTPDEFRADEKPAKVHRPARRREIRAADTPPIKVCNMRGGNTGIAAYRITSYAHLVSDVGRHKKKLLHQPEEKKVPGT